MKKKILFLFSAMFLAFGFVSHAEEPLPSDTSPIIETENGEVIETTPEVVEDESYIVYGKEYSLVEEGEGKMVFTFTETELHVVYFDVDNVMVDEAVVEYVLEGTKITIGQGTEEELSFALEGDSIVPYIETPIEETPTEDEDISIVEKGVAFWERWKDPVFSALASAISTATVLLTALGIILKLKRAINGVTDNNGKMFSNAIELVQKAKEENKNLVDVCLEAIAKSDETHNQMVDGAIAKVQEAMEVFKTFIDTNNDTFMGTNNVLTNSIDNVNGTIPLLVTQLDNFKEHYSNELLAMQRINQEQNAQFETLKELIALLVASTPTLASNGYAQKIIEVCSDKSYAKALENVKKVGA